jgi:hypothetical protein
MATDYVLFIHGVYTREKNPEQPTYADMLFDGIKNYVTEQNSGKPARDLEKVALYWGDVTVAAENVLLEQYQASDAWNGFWYKKFRSGMLLNFSGDAALYLSRYVGAKVAQKLNDDAEKRLGTMASRNPDTGDRLHLVAHSLGTVILFDLFFSTRWKPPAPGHQYAMSLRDVIYGIEPNWHQGICLGSITTMGSPLGLFKLMDTDTSDENNNENTHDITPHMQRMLKRLKDKLGGALPWFNFAHPGDPIACPLKPLILNMVDPTGEYIAVEDILVRTSNVLDGIAWLVNWTPLALLDSGGAHLSYIMSKHTIKRVASTIGQAIINAMPR